MAIPGKTVCCTASVTKASRRRATCTPTTAPTVPSRRISTSARPMNPSRYGSKRNARKDSVGGDDRAAAGQHHRAVAVGLAEELGREGFADGGEGHLVVVEEAA